MSVLVSCLNSNTTCSTKLLMHDPHLHDLDVVNVSVPSDDDLKQVLGHIVELQKSVAANRSVINKISGEVQTQIEVISQNIHNVQESQEKLKNNVSNTIQQQLSSGGQFFTKFADMTQKHVKEVQRHVNEIQSSARKMDNIATEIEAKACETQKQCIDTVKSVETRSSALRIEIDNGIAAVKKQCDENIRSGESQLSALRLEIDNGIGALKKQCSASEESLNCLSQNQLEKLSILNNTFKEDYSNAKRYLNVQVESVAGYKSQIEAQLSEAEKLFEVFSQEKEKVALFSSKIDTVNDKIVSLKLVLLDLNAKTQQAENKLSELIAIKEQVQQQCKTEFDIVIDNYLKKIEERQQQLEKIDGDVANKLLQCDNLIKEHEAYKDKQCSFFKRLKWLFIGEF